MRLAVLVVLLLAPAARAAEEPDDEIAHRHFDAGSRAYEARDYTAAVREFEAARTLRPVPELDYDIARCLDRMERPREAIAAYERFLERAPPSDDVESARQRVAVLRARVVLRRPPMGAVIGVGVAGLVALGVGAGLLGSTAVAVQQLDSSCAPVCGRDRWADLPQRRDAGVALVAIAGAAALTEVVLLALRARREGAR